MKTGVLIHSNTNNTLSVGERLPEALRSKGADAGLGGAVEKTSVVNWTNKAREEHLRSLIAAFTADAAGGRTP